MSDYLVIARKWRPQTFDDVVGQEHVVRTLKNAIGLERVAHSFIFSGPRGVGKTSVARIFSKALNCEQGPTPLPCGHCTNCREITDGISLDVHEIDGASNRGIDEVRELRENVKFRPVSSLYKIYIIDEVHMLTREAFNALLKTLEEPPPHVIFIFATTETQKIPATIMSRCQCFDFHRISLRQIASSLRKIAEAENIQISDSGLMWVAEAGDGSMRDAQSVFDQVISYAGMDISEAQVEEILGRTDKRFLFQASEAVFAGDAARCLTIIDDAYYAGLEMQMFYQMLLQHFRNLLLVKIVVENEEMLQVGEEELASLKQQASPVSIDTLQRMLDILMAEEDHLRRSRHPRLNLEMLLVRLAYMEPLIPIEQLVSRMENLETRLTGGGSTSSGTGKATVQTIPAYKKDPEPGTRLPVKERYTDSYGSAGPKFTQQVNDVIDDHQKDVNANNMDALWDGFKAAVKKDSPPLWSKIEPGRILSLENDILRIGCPKNNCALLHEDQKESLNKMARSFLNNDRLMLKIEPLAGEAEDKAANGSAGMNRHMESKRELLNHPAVQKILDIFDGAEVKEVITRRKSGEDIS